MAKSVARGKALVAKLRAQPGVRDPEALAAYLGRFKKARKAGASVAKAKAAAGGSSKRRKCKDDSTPENAREIQRLQSRGGIMGLPKGGLGEEANRRERERNKAEGYTPGIKGSDDPKKMSDADLDYFIKFAQMAQNARAQTQDVRQKMADRLIKLRAEKERRRNRRGLGYKY